MKITIDVNDFIHAFREASRHDNFSYDGLRALFYYLEDIEEKTGLELNLDVISLCCDYSEHPSAGAGAAEYGDWEPDADLDDKEIDALEWLRDRTTVIEVKGGSVIILGF